MCINKNGQVYGSGYANKTGRITLTTTIISAAINMPEHKKPEKQR